MLYYLRIQNVDQQINQLNDLISRIVYRYQQISQWISQVILITGDIFSENQYIYIYSPWANGPPWSSWVLPFCSGFRGLSEIILAMWPEKKTDSQLISPFFKMVDSKAEISNISEITSCWVMIWGSKPIFSCSRNQLNTLCSMVDHYYMCKGTKNIKKIQDGHQFRTLFR